MAARVTQLSFDASVEMPGFNHVSYAVTGICPILIFTCALKSKVKDLQS